MRFCVITHLRLGEKHLRRRVGGGRWKMAPNSTRPVFRADDNLPVITVHMDTLVLLVWPIGRYTVAPMRYCACTSMSKVRFSGADFLDFHQVLSA